MMEEWGNLRAAVLQGAIAQLKALMPHLSSEERAAAIREIFEDYCGSEEPCYCIRDD